ncbi:DUF4871 domain-containing protein [Paenibacillus sp. N1-5-1-14]|uniref:DUF4871 domain-containing protein n=1 Tax=Paenibacillus radicibacter TaxID=2972488 RepID=UPI0021595DF6|nr:DUF4871 domain-containing protein [Paenibacillus radicibacter]MCR8641956.1 DUF4871 domain-containing protein [Paenibacillus radicibacter]
MTKRNNEWQQSLKQSPFTQNYFTREHEQAVFNRIQMDKRGEKVKVGKVNRWFIPAMMISCLFFLMAVAIPFVVKEIEHRAAVKKEWDVRQEYWQDGGRVFSLFPGGDVPAGKINGYKIIVDQPMESLKNMQFFIKAIHQGSGNTQEIKTSFNVKRYEDNLTWVTTSFGLPLSGHWKLELYGDENEQGVIRYFGDVVIDIPEHSWEVSPTFKYNIYQLRGIENRMGVMDHEIIAGKPNKYMWFFWGDKSILRGESPVYAVRKGTNELILIEKSGFSYGSAFEIDHDNSIITSLNIPKPGIWRLMVYANNNLFDSVVVEVKQAP